MFREWLKMAKKTLSLVTVEPILAMCLISTAVCELSTQNLNLEKACRVSYNYEDSVCEALARQDFKDHLQLRVLKRAINPT